MAADLAGFSKVRGDTNEAQAWSKLTSEFWLYQGTSRMARSIRGRRRTVARHGTVLEIVVFGIKMVTSGSLDETMMLL